jgi:UDP-sulfoquinovose synthase
MVEPSRELDRTMRVCVLGGDGYLGWPTSLYFSRRGHKVLTIDNFAKRRWEGQCGVRPLQPIPSLAARIDRWRTVARRKTTGPIRFQHCDLSEDYELLAGMLRRFRPDALIHFAEQPSAPFSMACRENAIETQRNNVLGTLNIAFAVREACPDAHLVKLGTMGEYGTPNIDIEEGWLEVEHNGRRDRVLYPKCPGSLYHLSKVHDSANLEFTCRVWRLRVTDLNQGVVYGLETDETVLAEGLHTSFHYDAIFGTVLNRFITQAVLGVPLTLYGLGNQVRGLLNIRDTLRCIELVTRNPAAPGEFRVFNQFTEQFSIRQLADAVADAARAAGYAVEVAHVENPRVEAEEHYYNAKHRALCDLGLTPHLLDQSVLAGMIEEVARHRELIDPSSISPAICWRSREPLIARRERSSARLQELPTMVRRAANGTGSKSVITAIKSEYEIHAV